MHSKCHALKPWNYSPTSSVEKQSSMKPVSATKKFEDLHFMKYTHIYKKVDIVHMMQKEIKIKQ